MTGLQLLLGPGPNERAPKMADSESMTTTRHGGFPLRPAASRCRAAGYARRAGEPTRRSVPHRGGPLRTVLRIPSTAVDAAAALYRAGEPNAPRTARYMSLVNLASRSNGQSRGRRRTWRRTAGTCRRNRRQRSS